MALDFTRLVIGRLCPIKRHIILSARGSGLPVARFDLALIIHMALTQWSSKGKNKKTA
jgi:hypothetical protein